MIDKIPFKWLISEEKWRNFRQSWISTLFQSLNSSSTNCYFDYFVCFFVSEVFGSLPTVFCSIDKDCYLKTIKMAENVKVIVRCRPMNQRESNMSSCKVSFCPYFIVFIFIREISCGLKFMKNRFQSFNQLRLKFTQLKVYYLRH